MPKWADYGISKVRYNKERTHIDKVKVLEDKGELFGPEEEWTRVQVVSAIDEGTSFVTIIKKDNQWNKGQKVDIIIINKVKYIRTDKNSKESDNLENLPEF